MSTTTTTDTILWTVCTKCHGNGRRRRPWSKKARFQRKNKDPEHLAPSSSSCVPEVSCLTCGGSGLQRDPIAYSDGSTVVGTTATPAPPPPITPPPLHVAVIGGGVAGLAVAAALQHRGLRVTVYERDTSFHQRQQGYGLTLQQAAPQLAALGILELRDGITSTQHIVHDAAGAVQGTWGMRHWLKVAEVDNKDENDSDTIDAIDQAVDQEPNPSETEPAQERLRETADLATVKRRKRQNIHIARQALRLELLQAATVAQKRFANDSIPSVVQWGHRLVDYREHDDGVSMTFSVSSLNGEVTSTVEKRADILVGADGIRSHVRHQLLNNTTLSVDPNQDTTSLPTSSLRYLGCIVILGICPIASVVSKLTLASSPFIHLLDGETVFQTADGVTRMYMMPFSKLEYMWQLSFPFNEHDAGVLSSLGPEALQKEALRRCDLWHEPIVEILSTTPTGLVSGYPVYDLPILQPEQLVRSNSARPRRVTCIGDSIHCMSPFKGQGANQALLDALSLARILYRTQLSWNDAIKCRKESVEKDSAKLPAEYMERAILQYEVEMLQRSAVKVNASAAAAHFLHTSVAIQKGNITRGAAAAAAANAIASPTDLSLVNNYLYCTKS